MLELKELCFTIHKDGKDLNLVDEVSIRLPSSHFMAIVGPSGCGKTTLLRTIAGLNHESAGSIHWNGEDLADVGDFDPQEIGYVPQFSIAYDELTVDEAIESAMRLRVKTRSLEALDQGIDHVLAVTGLEPLADRMVKVLSGGQKRRLGLAMELVSNPQLLLCDEVTSGLDPRSERDIVRLLHQLSRVEERVIVSVTHSLAHLELYDSILVLHEGRVAYHGPPSQLTHYFSANDTEEIYPKLTKQDSITWQKSWLKHQKTYYDKIDIYRERKIESGEIILPKKEKKDDDSEEETQQHSVVVPGVISQFISLLQRRFKIFTRDKGQIFLQLAVLIAFPLLVTIFAPQASNEPLQYNELSSNNFAEVAAEAKEIGSQRGKLGSSLAGIVMFQIVLLSLMGSNNSAREVAGERLIWEKEKFGGVRPLAYLLSKLAFMSCLILVQSLIMAVWVHTQWHFPSDDGMGFLTHAALLIMVNSAITFICLGVSSLMKTAEQASLLSIYIVGFQLPLSGAVLALPEWVGNMTRPFISAYWSWSGSIKSMSDDEFQVIEGITETPFHIANTCFLVLGVHIFVGIILAYIGMCKHRWEH